ncbi:MAG: tetratricopeptide repeat protein [Pseudomonadota bacterium]
MPAPVPASPPTDNTPVVTAPTTVSPQIKPTSIPDAQAPRSLPAAVSLREQAAAAAAADNHNRAIGLLERAIRISPNDPATFAALAESHLALSRPQQALELTRRGLTLNPDLEQQLTLEALEQKCLALL